MGRERLVDGNPRRLNPLFETCVSPSGPLEI